MYRLSLWKDCTAGSFYSSLFMSELLNQNIKRLRYVLTHHRNKWHRARKLVENDNTISLSKIDKLKKYTSKR